MTEYKIFTHLSYDWMIVSYFFLGGLAAGAYFFSVAANYWIKEFKSLAKTAAILTPIALAIGLAFLLLDLGQPFRSWRIFLHFNPTSAISYGIWFLNIFFILSLVYAWFTSRGENEKAKKFAYLGLPFGLLVAIYTGVLLAQAPGKALWHSALLPVLFLIGGVISGIALVMLVSSGAAEKAVSVKVGRLLVGLLLVELGLILTELIILANGDAEAIMTVKVILTGQYSFLFWIVEILLGAIIPIFILFKTEVSSRAQAVAAMLILVGIFAMRFIIVVGGQIVS
ncbi:MAG: polysulfide reductase NrfD [Candidatus Omnitrophica bacterium]|nr:polysulfide reductase NrfD [Candidatus Omnitrophota bacterium]MBU4590374.1 polysulfide reductase NrfD [Candidatus Omnitrophota bacterium]